MKLKKNVTKFRTVLDTDGILFALSYIYIRMRLLLLQSCSTLIGTISCRIKKIEINKNRFIGIPIFHKHYGSKITIGNSSTFISAKTSFVNPAGINRKCIFSTMKVGAKIVIGNNCGFSGTVISATNSVVIGNNVNCGANTTIYDHDFHSYNSNENSKNVAFDVFIEDDVWLGLNVIVLKGVTIGKGSVIAAGSIVTHSIPQYTLAAGIPAQVINNLEKL